MSHLIPGVLVQTLPHSLRVVVITTFSQFSGQFRRPIGTTSEWFTFEPGTGAIPYLFREACLLGHQACLLVGLGTCRVSGRCGDP